MRVSVALPIVAMLAATIGSSSQAFAKPRGEAGANVQPGNAEQGKNPLPQPEELPAQHRCRGGLCL